MPTTCKQNLPMFHQDSICCIKELSLLPHAQQTLPESLLYRKRHVERHTRGVAHTQGMAHAINS